jgi:hypothetical protein
MLTGNDALFAHHRPAMQATSSLSKNFEGKGEKLTLAVRTPSECENGHDQHSRAHQYAHGVADGEDDRVVVQFSSRCQ